MFRRNDSMKSFKLEKAVKPVGRPEKNSSFKMCNEYKSFRLCK